VSKFHDDNTVASNPGNIRLSRERFQRLEPLSDGVPNVWLGAVASREEFEELLDEHLRVGASEAACVISVEPLLVAAYTGELDCVAMLNLPSWLAEEHGLEAGRRLLTVNTYYPDPPVAEDLLPGPKRYTNNKIRYLLSFLRPSLLGPPRWTNFFPVIADFFSKDVKRIYRRKANIPEKTWIRCHEMGTEYLRNFPEKWRYGTPYRSSFPAGTKRESKASKCYEQALDCERTADHDRALRTESCASGDASRIRGWSRSRIGQSRTIWRGFTARRAALLMTKKSLLTPSLISRKLSGTVKTGKAIASAGEPTFASASSRKPLLI
jgi:hypothetical protein